MENEYIKIRKCISCSRRDKKFNFIRINKIKIKESPGFKLKISDVNDKKHVDGRTAYICANSQCLLLAKKKSRIEKSLKCRIDSEIYDKISNLVNFKN